MNGSASSAPELQSLLEDIRRFTYGSKGAARDSPPSNTSVSLVRRVAEARSRPLGQTLATVFFLNSCVHHRSHSNALCVHHALPCEPLASGASPCVCGLCSLAVDKQSSLLVAGTTILDRCTKRAGNRVQWRRRPKVSIMHACDRLSLFHTRRFPHTFPIFRRSSADLGIQEILSRISAVTNSRGTNMTSNAPNIENNGMNGHPAPISTPEAPNHNNKQLVDDDMVHTHIHSSLSDT
jgi:hypothetical protein